MTDLGFDVVAAATALRKSSRKAQALPALVKDRSALNRVATLLARPASPDALSAHAEAAAS